MTLTTFFILCVISFICGLISGFIIGAYLTMHWLRINKKLQCEIEWCVLPLGHKTGHSRVLPLGHKTGHSNTKLQ